MKTSNATTSVISYNGEVGFETIGDLIVVLKKNMLEIGIRQGIYKKVLNIMIESLENIYRYKENFKENPELVEEYPPHFEILKSDQQFIICSSNPILTEHKDELEKRLVQVKNMDKEEIRSLYKQIIANGKFSDKGGAGLGIVEIVKSSDAIEYKFTPINESFILYQLTVFITLPG